MANESFGFEFTVEQGLKVITLETLKYIAPKAYAAMESFDDFLDGSGKIEVDEVTPIWFISDVPQRQHESEDPDEDTWTETNEPELAERIAEGWKDYAVNVDGEEIVILCSTYDDEYGWLWCEADGEWETYMY